MHTYQHYSFDLWMTLIRSDPAFKQERTRYFHARFNRAGTSLETVAAVFRQVDLLGNAINEKTGGNLTAEELHLMVISGINNHACDFADVDLPALYEDMEQLVLRHLPRLYCRQTTAVLQRLRDNGEVTCSLLSNTAFIKGRTLRRVLQELELDRYFDFQLYSDEVGLSKPNSRLFELLVTTATATNSHRSLQRHDILHIGDNPLADGHGATACGLHSRLINSNNQCITTILTS